MTKPLRPKPMLYAWYLSELMGKAKEMGYNLIIHGSFSRDCDLVAVAWTDNPDSSFNLINELSFILTNIRREYKEDFMYSVLPGGRESYVINLNRNTSFIGKDENGESIYNEDPQYYLDISVVNAKK